MISSLARPEGNLTGFVALNADMEGRRLELLKEAKDATEPKRSCDCLSRRAFAGSPSPVTFGTAIIVHGDRLTSGYDHPALLGALSAGYARARLHRTEETFVMNFDRTRGEASRLSGAGAAQGGPDCGLVHAGSPHRALLPDVPVPILRPVLIFPVTPPAYSLTGLFQATGRDDDV